MRRGPAWLGLQADLQILRVERDWSFARSDLNHARAFELFGLGEHWTAARAAEAGLVNAVVPAGELEAKALAAAHRLAAKPRAALLAARRMLKGEPALISKTIADEVAVYKDLMRTPEAKEAFAAFLEKRKPDFAKARRGG